MTNNVDLSKYSSMKTGGIAEKCYFPENAAELCNIVSGLENDGERYQILGNMSNVLIPDGKVEFVPVITTNMKNTQITENDDGSVSVYAECGVMLTKLAFDMCKKGYAGMVFAYGIPGTIGGAVFMNAGAYGSEISALCEYVDYLDVKSGKVCRVDACECDFGYRKSIFAENNYVILGASLKLEKGNADELIALAKETMQKRIDKQPLEYPSCGSAFKRPEGYFAGALIEQSGLKGFSVGGAQVSVKHAGFVINKGGATTKDVTDLMEAVRKKVYEDHGVELEPEIRVLK